MSRSEEYDPMPDRSIFRSALRAAGALAALALTAGCSPFQTTPQESPRLHLLQPPSATVTPARRTDATVEVGVPRAAPGFDTPRIAYVERPYSIDYYSRGEWADAPARMIGPLVARALDRSGAFAAVVEAPTSVQSTLRVDLELVRLQQDFTVAPSRADLAIRAQVVDVRARRVLATLLVEETEPAAAQDAYGGVAAANAALGRAIERIVALVVAEGAAMRP